MHGPGEIVAAVIIHRDPDVEDHESEAGEAVALEDDWVYGGPEAKADQLPGGEVLSGPGERGVVFVVDGVEGSVEPPDSVVDHMPEVVLEIEEYGAAQDTDDELRHWWCLITQGDGGSPIPLGDSGWEDKHHMVVARVPESLIDVVPCYLLVGVDLVAVDDRTPGRQEVQDHVESAGEEVGRDGDDNWEERRSQHISVIVSQIVPQRLEQGLVPDILTDVGVLDDLHIRLEDSA